jgi:hypothetical protein
MMTLERPLRATTQALATALLATAAAGALGQPAAFDWRTVVNNNDQMPGAPEGRTFNSYNQPSVNVHGLVVIRARSKGGGGGGGGGGGENQPTHGIYTRDMAVADSPIVRILDRSSEVPEPNNLDSLFVETPSFPRIDMWSDTIATRGNHPPVWRYDLPDGSETRAGTTGIYSNPFGSLVTGAAKLGAVPGFEFFAVPDLDPPTTFEVFPGAPAVTGGRTIVFKGNYTVDDIGRTGVFYRDLTDEPIVLADSTVDSTVLLPAAGESPVVLIANSTDTLIPGDPGETVFGSTAPPSAADGKAVFAGFDVEADPTLGGIYLADLEPEPELTPLVSINGEVPGQPPGSRFNKLGEAVAFDGRHVGFWGAWGEETKLLRLYCPTEGNRDRIAFCNQQLDCADTPEEERLGDENSICPGDGGPCYQEKEVPVHQGIFVHDTVIERTRPIAAAPSGFDDFLFWNYSGKPPCVGSGHTPEGGDDDGEPARWRSSAFVAVSGRGASFRAVFKARTGELDVDGVYIDPVDGIYLVGGPGRLRTVTVLDTTMDGQALDPDAPEDSTITELGLEREGLRGDWLAISAKMGVEGGAEDDGIAGVYLTEVRGRSANR